MKPLHIPRPSVRVLLLAALLALGGLQVAFELRLLAPLKGRVVVLEEAVQHLPARPSGDVAAPPKTQLQLDAILLRLEGDDATQARIERLHQTAAAHGVLLRKANYKTLALAAELSRHEVQADVSGSYPAIREFLRELLEQDPAVAIESLEFSRPPGAIGVRAQVRLALYLRSSAP